MSKALGFILLIIGFLLTILMPLTIFFPSPALFSLTFTHPNLGTALAIFGSVIIVAGGIVLTISQDKFSPKRAELIDKQFPCPVCKKDVFAWGKTPSARIRLRVGIGQLVWVRVCQNCGNVQQFTKTD